MMKTKEVRGMEDQQIVALYFARNEQAIRETEAKYGRLCYQISYNILKNEEDSEECVSDTYLTVWKKIPPAKPSYLKAFVCKIARNLSLKKLEFNTAWKRNQGMVVPLSELEEVIPDSHFNPDVSDEEAGKLISDFLWKEKEEARNVFLRRYWYLDSIRDIAERYSYTESKVKNMLYHTRNRLREYLKKEGVEV